MIVYVPGRMPTHPVGPYGAARYPGTLLGAVPGFYNSFSNFSTSSTYYESLNIQRNPQQRQEALYHSTSLNLPIWPRRMPAEEELGSLTVPGLARLRASPGTLVNGGPPSPTHSDSDASNSSLELGSVRRGENAQLKCR